MHRHSSDPMRDDVASYFNQKIVELMVWLRDWSRAMQQYAMELGIAFEPVLNLDNVIDAGIGKLLCEERGCERIAMVPLDGLRLCTDCASLRAPLPYIPGPTSDDEVVRCEGNRGGVL